ncbi:hypothetical protein RRF57_007263 [Xylaria bambusicola]|uniref:Uncharacterized protein n=1 Tax=Xylaria bambusicola TaxID=326684 RepID=A0AAN7V0C4_9PEZI
MYDNGQCGGASSKRRSQPRRQVYYISPYHDNPVDFEKYDEEVNTTETTDKSSTNSMGTRCWSGDCEKREINVAKRKAHSKTLSRPLTTGCAADFELFGVDR